MEIRTGGPAPQSLGIRPDHTPAKPEAPRAAPQRIAVAAEEPAAAAPPRRNLPRGSLVNITA